MTLSIKMMDAEKNLIEPLVPSFIYSLFDKSEDTVTFHLPMVRVSKADQQDDG